VCAHCRTEWCLDCLGVANYKQCASTCITGCKLMHCSSRKCLRKLNERKDHSFIECTKCPGKDLVCSSTVYDAWHSTRRTRITRACNNCGDFVPLFHIFQRSIDGCTQCRPNRELEAKCLCGWGLSQLMCYMCKTAHFENCKKMRLLCMFVPIKKEKSMKGIQVLLQLQDGDHRIAKLICEFL